MFVLLALTCWAIIPLVSSTPFFPTFTPPPNGINCKGSAECEYRLFSPTVSQELANIIDVMAGPDDRWYSEREQIGGAILFHGAISRITLINTSQIAIMLTRRSRLEIA